MPSPPPLLTGRLAVLDDALRRAAAGQGGVVTAEQVRARGGSPALMRSLVRSGAWRRERRGVYADLRYPGAGDGPGQVAGSAPSAGLRSAGAAPAAEAARVLAAAVAAVRGEAYASHLAAAALLGLPLPRSLGVLRPTVVRPVITRPPGRAGNDLRGVEVRVRDVDLRDVVMVHGIPVLGGSSVVLDCAEDLPGPDALAIADAALRRGITTVEALAEGLARRRGRRGVRAAQLVVARADPRSESWLESASRWWILDAGLPRPELQVELAGADGVVRLDFLFREQGVAGEADGLGKYEGPDGIGVLVREKRREAWIRDTWGLDVVRWMTPDVARPVLRAAWIGRLARAVDRGGHRQRHPDRARRTA